MQRAGRPCAAARVEQEEGARAGKLQLPAGGLAVGRGQDRRATALAARVTRGRGMLVASWTQRGKHARAQAQTQAQTQAQAQAQTHDKGEEGKTDKAHETALAASSSV